MAIDFPHFYSVDDYCPACEQRDLLVKYLNSSDDALYRQIQSMWPLDIESVLRVIPTPLRLHSDSRYRGKGVTIAMIDTGFYPHPDLTQPTNRIRAWVNATEDPVDMRQFDADDSPEWPHWDEGYDRQWHGTMTSMAAAGNGYMCHGLFPGLASSADIVLIQARPFEGDIGDEAIVRALNWILDNHKQFNIRVVNISLPGEDVPLHDNPIDVAVAELVAAGVVVVAASGNDGQRKLVPPATAPQALTIGGIDDQNDFGNDKIELWHSNYGSGISDAIKPELVAPSIWIAAPVLPKTQVAEEAEALFTHRNEEGIGERISELKLITQHYQHVDGTSFAAPIVASAVACMIEANDALTPPMIRQILQETARPIADAPREKQGAGVLNVSGAVARARRERHATLTQYKQIPAVEATQVTFILDNQDASSVELVGSWNGWERHKMESAEKGVWQLQIDLPPAGDYHYKFLLDESQWIDDPANPLKTFDETGGYNSQLTISETADAS